MKSVFSAEHTSERAYIDIETCFGLSNTAKVIDGNYFIDNPHIYLNASERVKLAVNSEVKEDSKVLTVASSGDYLLDSVLYGAKKIVNYDINSYQYYVTCLKVWAVQTLEYEEYIQFFTTFRNDEITYLSPETFEKITRPFMDEPAYPFWAMFAKRRQEEINLFRQTIMEDPIVYETFKTLMPNQPIGMVEYVFSSEQGPNLFPGTCTATRMIQAPEAELEGYGYLSSEENYNKVKSRIDTVDLSYFTSNVLDIPANIPKEEEFDTIFLSNIPFYMEPDEFVKSINGLVPLLSENGTIVYYHQNMKQRWFKNKTSDKNFELSDKDFVRDSFYPIARTGASRCLNGHRKLVREQLAIKMVEVPTYHGMDSIKSPYDVKVMVKAKRKKGK